MVPWRISRYITKEIIPYFLLCLLIATGIVFAQQMGRFSELFVKRNVPGVLVETLLLTVLSRILIITLPISLLIGIFLGLSRLSSDSEIVVLKSSGLNRRQLFIPLFGLSLVVSLLMGYLTLVELPRTASRFREIRGQLIVQGIRTQVKPRVFDTRFADQVLYIEDINRRTDLWEGIFLASFKSPQAILMTGQRGILELGQPPGSSLLHLFDGVIHRIEHSKERGDVYHIQGFSSYHARFETQPREAERFQLETRNRPQPIEEKSLTELLRMKPGDRAGYLKARVEAGRRLALPFACLLFAPLGLSFGLLRRSSGRPEGFIIGLLLATLYYLLLFASEKLARSGSLPPLLAMWMGNVLFAFLAACGLREQKSLGRWRALIEMTVDGCRLALSRLNHRQGRKTNRPKSGSQYWLPRFHLSWLPRFHLIDLYLVKSFILYFILSLSSLLLIFMIFTSFELSPDVIRNQVGFTNLLTYLFFLSPSILQTLTPICILIAVLISIALLARTNEIMALKSGGVSAYRITSPLLLFCLMFVALTQWWQNDIVPPANRRQDRLRFYIKKGRFPSPIELSPTLVEENWVHGEKGRIFHFQSFNPTTNEFRRLWILDLDKVTKTINRRIEAESARWNPRTSVWELANVQIWKFERDQLVRSQTHERYALSIHETPAYLKQYIKKPAYMSRSELTVHIGELERGGFDVTELRIALQRKIAQPYACLVMALVGIPFGFTLRRRGALYGVSVGISLGLIYWLSIGLFEQLGRYEYVQPVIAAWAPNGLFAGGGGYGLFRVRT